MNLNVTCLCCAVCVLHKVPGGQGVVCFIPFNQVFVGRNSLREEELLILVSSAKVKLNPRLEPFCTFESSADFKVSAHRLQSENAVTPFI